VLPAELTRFLARHTYSLLIKGEAATGKTILALSILREIGADGGCLYLSTRVSPSQLFENHPWLAEGEMTERRDPGDHPEDEPRSGERFVDARLDEPVPFLERITNELMDVRSPTIVVDSWDPIGAMMDDETLASNTKVLQTWRERADAKIVFLVEDSDDISLDSLFDGVVCLDRYYQDGRMVRMMRLSKLTGVKVARPSPLFTLDGGVFQSFRAYSPLEITAQKPEGWSWEKRGNSTGYFELDELLDRTLPRGTIVTLSLAPGVNSAMVLLLLSGIIGRGTSRARATFFRPFEGIGFEQARGALGDVIPIEGTAPQGGGPGSSERAESLTRQVERLNGTRQGKKVVALAGSEFLLDSNGDGDRERLLEFMRSGIDLSVMVGGNDAFLEGAARVADVSLRLSEINGTPLLHAQLPWTEYFVITLKADRAPATVGLVPMV
jgi:KaiC/GvpD/RAD55 family RecA-like ATPase